MKTKNLFIYVPDIASFVKELSGKAYIITNRIQDQFRLELQIRITGFNALMVPIVYTFTGENILMLSGDDLRDAYNKTTQLRDRIEQLLRSMKVDVALGCVSYEEVQGEYPTDEILKEIEAEHAEA